MQAVTSVPKTSNEISVLRGRLEQLLVARAQNFMAIAQIVRELEDLGDDLSDLRNGLVNAARLVGQGQLLPQLAIILSGIETILFLAAACPRPDQEKMIKEPLEVCVEQDGQITVRLLRVESLTVKQARIILGKGHVANKAEQLATLARLPATKPSHSLPSYVKFDGKTRVEINGPLTRRQVAQILEAMS